MSKPSFAEKIFVIRANEKEVNAGGIFSVSTSCNTSSRLSNVG